MSRGLLTALAVLVAGGAAFAQSLSLSTNEPTKAEIRKAGEKNEWVVELKQEGKVRLTVTCEAGHLEARLMAMGDSRAAKQLFRVNGKGGGDNWGVNGKGEFEAESEKLPKGKYTVVIGGVSKEEKGEYIITLVSPKFEEKKDPKDPKADSVAPAPGGGTKPNEVADLKKEVVALKDEVVDLKSRLRILEKLVADKK